MDYKYKMIDAFIDPPEDFDNLADVLAIGGAFEYNMQTLIIRYCEKWLKRHGQASSDAPRAYYQIGMAHSLLNNYAESSTAFRAAYEQAAHRG